MGRDFRDLEAQVAVTRSKSGCFLGNNLWAYPYGTFYDTTREHLPFQREGGRDVIVYIHTEGQERTIGSLEGIFVSEAPIVIDSGANIPCRREQMPDFEEKYKGRFVSFNNKLGGS